jgi:neutral ceramidase
MNLFHQKQLFGLRACLLIVVTAVAFAAGAFAAEEPSLEVGIAVRDITPDGPIWLAGYAGRKRPSEKVDSPLVAQAFALKSSSGERLVLVSLDNCEVSHAFVDPIAREVEQKHQLKRGAVIIVSSHTHSAPVLEHTLISMYSLKEKDFEQIQKYSETLRARLVETIGSSLTDLKPARLEHGVGRATFAMNRRVYREDRVDFGENPEGPIDWDVPVLKVKGTNDVIRAILFGYACHGTSIAGDDFYIVSGDYMAYARQHIEAVYPGAVAIYLTGMGADSNPSPRGTLLDAKRHGIELAGAVISVLNRSMRPVNGPLRLVYAEADLPFVDPPSRDQIEKDAKSDDVHIRLRAEQSLKLLAEGKSLPASLALPLAAARIGDDLTFVAMGGEVVVDYARQFKRLFASDHPWLIGYAYEVPCYIPSMRILKEGGYEAQSSLIYYGYYGPFRGRIEELLVKRMTELVGATRAR